MRSSSELQETRFCNNYLESMSVQKALKKLNFKTGKGTAKGKETASFFLVPPAPFCSFTQLTLNRHKGEGGIPSHSSYPSPIIKRKRIFPKFQSLLSHHPHVHNNNHLHPCRHIQSSSLVVVVLIGSRSRSTTSSSSSISSKLHVLEMSLWHIYFSQNGQHKHTNCLN